MLNHYEKLSKLKRFTDNVGKIYGTEDFAVYLYSIIKITKAKNIIEFGTGLATTTLWAALALEENQEGVIHTIDDGSDWEHLSKAKDRFIQYYSDNYKQYISNVISDFELLDRVIFYNQKIQRLDINNSIDIIFSDYSHGPYSILKLLADYLTKMSSLSYIFIDSASTYYSSYQTLEALIGILNQGRVPLTLDEMIDSKEKDDFVKKVQSSKFELTHIIENKSRDQNSTAQIKISPLDIMPHPRVNIRF